MLACPHDEAVARATLAGTHPISKATDLDFDTPIKAFAKQNGNDLVDPMKGSSTAHSSFKAFKPIKLGKKPKGTRPSNFSLLQILADSSVNLKVLDEDELRLAVFDDSQLLSGGS